MRATRTHRLAQELGRRGGRKRAARLSAARKREIAALGGLARAQSLAAARRIDDNRQYAAVMDALRPVTVVRQPSCRGPLPGIYPAGSRHG